MLKVQVTDSLGSREGAGVSENSLWVSQIPFPPFVTQKVVPFRQLLSTDGTATGPSDMRVVGTLTSPIQFFVEAPNASTNRYISILSFIIADAGAVLNRFGALVALVNGCKLHYNTGLGTFVDIHPALKTNFDFMRLALFNPPIGDAATAFRANNIVGASEGYMATVYLNQLVPPFGIQLAGGTNQRLILEVRDNTTGVDQFDCIAYGFDRYL